MKLCCSATRLAAPLALLGSLVLVSCVVPVDEEPVEAISETEQSLVASNWSAPARISASEIWSPQVGTLNGTTYMVHFGGGQIFALKWRRLVGTSWTAPVAIPDQSSRQRVSLAAFNGFLYMVHSDDYQETKLWVSRFSPATAQWTTAFQIPHTSLRPPALAAFNNRLYLIGVDPATKNLWSATMTADEVFTPASPMNGHYSASRVSAAVIDCKLYIAHRTHNDLTIVYNSFDGKQWGVDQTIPAGPGGAAIAAAEPVIAERAGYLHLLRRDTASSSSVPVWWTYFNGTSWASEVTIPGTSTYFAPSLIHGGAGLVAITEDNEALSFSQQYTQPLPPRAPPSCSVLQPLSGG